MTTKIRIVTDSTADIPAEMRSRLQIEMVPLKVHFGKDTFLDSVTIQAEQFYEKLGQSQQLPTTSQPSPVDFLEVFKSLTADPEVHVISIHLSSALSGTYQSAVLAKSLLDDNANITIIDSRSASYGCGMLVVEAAEWADAGKSVDEIVNRVEELRNATGLYFLVDTLEYLQKGGRIGKAAALFGSLLNIKPILTVDNEGEISAVDKIRGQKKAMVRIIELLDQHFAGKSIDMTIAHSQSQGTAEEFGAMISNHFDVKKVQYTSLGPVIGTHVGPGTVAVFAKQAD
ncbi:DegV family protein [Paenibacillus turpanensis]|uniref:DegV family protein n=1 Tax=Paenibacillus turpanensis TaxID=2689078 RepID=UPI001409DC51|nr:DegV family protein [Paenibacillus turpanensis]